MLRSAAGFLPVVALVLMTACRDSAIVDPSRFETETISRIELPAVFDTTRTYVYRYPGADPESLFVVLLRADFPVVQAWHPLDNRCMDPLGPRFTVELTRPDERMAAHLFGLEGPRLACATQLLRFKP